MRWGSSVSVIITTVGALVPIVVFGLGCNSYSQCKQWVEGLWTAASIQTEHDLGLQSGHEVCAHSGQVDYCVSSVLPPEQGNTYGPENLADGRPETAWVPNSRSAPDGIGEHVTLRFQEPRRVVGIRVLNGYDKTPSLYLKNDRPARVRIALSNGKQESVELEDRQTVQDVSFNSGNAVRWVALTIESVHRGSKYRDAAISELGVY